MTADITVRRVYDTGPVEGAVFLVDGIWPRGVRKDGLRLDRWARETAPSADLRRWFGHRPERFDEFRTRYRRELDGNPDAVRPLLEAARRGPVTLLYGARDTEHNNAVVLGEYLRERIAAER
ncbi:hypothetical protein GCM10017673_30800 [Streptosporangium violaceochromogenes]|nr:hypothetical protein GCM10017673_30800 [Streptosporangium violaceochromogenes]